MNNSNCLPRQQLPVNGRKPSTKRLTLARSLLPALTAVSALSPASVQACAACYGQSDSAMAAGMNWGILSLLGIIVFVLGGVAGFFVFLARRSARVPLPVHDSESVPAEQSTSSAMIPAAAQSASPEIVFARGNLRSSGLAHRRSACSRTRGSAGNLRGPRGRS